MVTLIISLKGRPKQTLSFPGDESKTTVKEVKAAVQAKFPHVRSTPPVDPNCRIAQALTIGIALGTC